MQILKQNDHDWEISTIKTYRVRITEKFLNKIENSLKEDLSAPKSNLYRILAQTKKSERQFLLKEIEAGHIDGNHFQDQDSKCGCIYGTILKKNKINVQEAFDGLSWNRNKINKLLQNKKHKLQLNENNVESIEFFILQAYPGLTHKDYIPLALVHKWIIEYDSTTRNRNSN